MQRSAIDPATEVVGRLRDAVSGRIISPDDPGYDDARATLYGDPERRPAVIVKAANADDVAAVVRLARETGLELAVRSGGHSGVGHGMVDGGIVLDLGDMRTLDIDVTGRTAWVEPGLTTGEYTAAADAHDLATGFGDTGSVGIGGITVGGGVGYLVRRHGLTIDDLLAADVVTADGELLHVDAKTHPDLFWAIRGGGGNLGVVTRFQLRLHGLGEIVGGILVLPATADTIAGFIAAADAAPDELSTIANVMPCPPMPFVAEEHHGALVILAMIVHAGSGEAGEQAVAPFRALATPLADMLGPKRYPEMFAPEEESDVHPIPVSRTLFVESIDRNVAASILDHLGASNAMMPVAQLRVLGGAMARVPADATAFAHRSRRIMVNVAALFLDPAEKPAHVAWLERFAADLRQGDDAAYVNFLTEDGPERIRAAYPGATLDRLAAVKARYDPANLFHLNQNIAPATVAGGKE